MINGKRVLCLIPARAGSKGLPGKNIKPLLGKPLIGWTIEEALKSSLLDRVIVSTDGDDIAKYSKSIGAEVPFMRPDYLAADHSSSFDVIKHAIDWCNSKKDYYDIIILLEPTSPLRTVEDINSALESFASNLEAESLVSVCKVKSANPAFLVTENKGYMKPYDEEMFGVKRRQDVSDCYFLEGSLYVSDINLLIERKTFYHEKCLLHKIPEWKSFEIDTLEDFQLISAILEAKLKNII